VHLSSLLCQPQLKKVMTKFKEIEEGLTVMVKDREYFFSMRMTTQNRFQAGKRDK